MITVSVYEQEMFGQTHWRVMRDDGQLIFGRHQTDFPSREDASIAINGVFRREKLGAGQIRFFTIDRQCNGRRLPVSVTPIIER